MASVFQRQGHGTWYLRVKDAFGRWANIGSTAKTKTEAWRLASDFERKGLEAVSKNPSQPFTGFIREGGKRFFKAVYADTAVSHTCVDCHNAHANSPRQDYKLHDVMGGIIITLPVGQ